MIDIGDLLVSVAIVVIILLLIPVSIGVWLCLINELRYWK